MHLLHVIRENDPGGFQLKNASKLLLAVVLSMAVLSFLGNKELVVFAALAAGHASIGIRGERLKNKVVSILIADAAFIVLFFLAVWSKSNPVLNAVLLVGLSFFVMFVRKYGERYTMFPLFAWVFFFLVSILHIGSNPILMNAMGVLGGLLMAALVQLLVLREDRRKLFCQNLSAYFKSYADALLWVASTLKTGMPAQEYSWKMQAYKAHIVELSLLNKGVLETISTVDKKASQKLNRMHIAEVALTKALAIVFEGVETMLRCDFPLDDALKAEVITVLRTDVRLLLAAKPSDKTLSVAFSDRLSDADNALSRFKDVLTGCDLAQKKGVIGLINVSLGLRLILKNVRAF